MKVNKKAKTEKEVKDVKVVALEKNAKRAVVEAKVGSKKGSKGKSSPASQAKSSPKSKANLKASFFKMSKKDKMSGISFLGLPMKNVLLLWTGFVLLILFGAIFFLFRDQVLIVLPGFYENAAYNEISIKKNDLIDKNNQLLLDIDDLNLKFNELGESSEDIGKKIDVSKEILVVLEEVDDNLDTVIAYNNELMAMRLPSNVEKYVDISKDLDEIRKDSVGVFIDYINARIDVYVLNRKRAEFDECLGAINWAASDREISAAVGSCRVILTEVQSQIKYMQDHYSVELPQMSNYFDLMGQQWEASSAYYNALADNNYNLAKEHDDVFIEKKRLLSEIDVEVFNEFNGIIVNDLRARFDELSKEEEEKSEEAKKWYDTYLKN